jgi:hypothetical protein
VTCRATHWNTVAFTRSKTGPRRVGLGYDRRVFEGVRTVRWHLAVAAALLLSFGAAGAAAHHSIAAQYDRAQTVEFVGVLVSHYFINPHVWFFFTEVQPDGTTKGWGVEGGPPNLMRRAIVEQFGSLEMEPGKTYTVQVAPNRTEPFSGFLKSMLLPNGTLFRYPQLSDP